MVILISFIASNDFITNRLIWAFSNVVALGVFKNNEESKIYDPGIVSHGFDLAESKYVG